MVAVEYTTYLPSTDLLLHWWLHAGYSYGEDGYHNRPPKNGYDHHEGYRNGYRNGYNGYDGYDGYGDGPDGPPPSRCPTPDTTKNCGPTAFTALTGNTCIDPYSGEGAFCQHGIEIEPQRKLYTTHLPASSSTSIMDV